MKENDNIPVGRREDEHLDHDRDRNVPILTGIVIAGTDRPGWKISQAARPGSEPEAVAEDGWTGDLPEEVRHARTTGSTNQHNKSQEVKDGPEGMIETAEPNMMTDYCMSRNLRVDENDPFDRQANDDIDCMLRMMIDPKKYDPEDSLKMEENNMPEYNEEINFEEKVCLELKEMRVLDINPDELRAWMIPEYRNADDHYGVRNKPGVDEERYKNGTWMLSGWVGKINPTSSRTVGRGKNCVHEQCTNKPGPVHQHGQGGQGDQR